MAGPPVRPEGSRSSSLEREGDETRSGDPEREGTAPIACDFCGDPSPRVRRVALDADYERLRTAHRELYACPRCSERKERARLGLKR